METAISEMKWNCIGKRAHKEHMELKTKSAKQKRGLKDRDNERTVRYQFMTQEDLGGKAGADRLSCCRKY